MAATGMDPSFSTQPAPPNTETTNGPSVPQTTPPLLPIVTGAASGLPSPPTRLRKLLIDLQVISLSILRVIGAVTILFILPPALFASIGAIIMLLGNSVASTRHATWAVASIGVVGSLLLYHFLCLLYLLIPNPKPTPDVGTRHLVLVGIIYLSFPPVAGLIGSAVLLHYHVDLDGIDISQGSFVAFFGGSIFFGIAVVLTIFGCSFMVFLSLIFWPTRVVIMAGVERVRAKWTEKRNHYGSRGDDPEINAELQNLPGRD